MAAHFHYRASYLYLLRLDRSELQAEFARRNPQSAACPISRERALPNQCAVKKVRCNLEVCVCVIAYEPHRDPGVRQQFDLWRIDAHRSIEHRGNSLGLEIDHDHHRLIRVDLPASICHGDRIGFVIPCGKHVRHVTREVAQANVALIGKPSAPGRAWRPSPQQILLVRALIALDAHLAGGSYRQIAEAVFGTRAVRERWGRDSTLKEQTRYLVRKGCALMKGGKTVV
jgi:hypothetical protein